MTRLLAILLLTAAPAAAQRTGTIPHSLTVHWGEGELVLPWGRSTSRWQQVADRAALPPDLIPGRQITHVGIRRTAQEAVTAVALDTEIALYDSAIISAASLNAQFAGNRTGSQGGVVFARRVVNLPAVPLIDPSGSAWFLPLDAPRPFVGPNLLIEIVNRGGSVGYTGWYADAAQSLGPDGSFAEVGTKCGNTLNMILSTGPYRPGATFRVTEFYASPTAVPIHALGFSAIVAGFGALPLDLTPFGAPGCVLRTSLDLLALGGGGPGANVDYAVPADPTLAGVKLYTQWLNADPGANPLGITVSAARVLSLGSRSYDLAHTERDSDSLDTLGTGPHRGGGAVVLLRYQ